MAFQDALPLNVKRFLRRILEQRGHSLFASVSLDYLDLQLVEILNRKRHGTFVEAGANDGINQSNTYYLERHLGWKGLLVEADPNAAAICKRNRPNAIVEHCALVREGYGQSSVTLQRAGLMSIVDDGVLNECQINHHVEFGRKVQFLEDRVPSIEVPAKSLSALLQSHEIDHVDFFSLDVEGYELEVLQGIDFDAVRFENILIECRHDNEASIEGFMEARGFKWVRKWENRSYSNVLFANHDGDENNGNDRAMVSS